MLSLRSSLLPLIVIGLLEAGLIVVQFPYDSDTQLSPTETAKLIAFYAKAYAPVPDAGSPIPEDGEYVKRRGLQTATVSNRHSPDSSASAA